MNVLFVCTGNVCRSPMAEGFLKHEGSARGLDLAVRSTGTHAWDGRAATIDGRRVMQEMGVPIDDHRTLSLTRSLVDWADLVVGLATEHVREVGRDYPDASARTFTLKEFVELLPGLPDYEDARSWVAAAHSSRSGNGSYNLDVDDPFGEREEAYRRVATEILGLIEALAAGFEDKRIIAG